MSAKQPVVLIILDGWGYREETDSNAIYHAKTPFWDQLWEQRPRTLISGSGLDVGLPDGQMGNSEVGHMSLGAGRVIYQNITRIDKAISDGDFFTNPAYVEAVDKAVNANKAVHIMGLLSPGGVHSHDSHIRAMVELAAKRGAKKVYVHGILDGRDTPPRSAEQPIAELEAKFKEQGVGQIASLIGRYFAMDRDNRWDRVEQAYNLYTQGQAEFSYNTAAEALAAAYARDENDEFVKASTILEDGQAVSIEDGDSLIFMNFRADRAREITRAFVEAEGVFEGFKRQQTPDLASFVMTTEYAADIQAPCAFKPEALVNVLGEHLQNLGKTQLRIAETEKYAHVTFFFSGGREALFDGEKRELIKSPDVATYDLQPEMSAPEVTEKLVAAIESGEFDTIICNYANGDMVGHTGVFDAAVQAAQTIDQSLQTVVTAIEAAGGQALITADHGNCEQMLDPNSGQAHTAHTCEHVPLIYIGEKPVGFHVEDGRLSDIAPTILHLMDVDIPSEMSGRVLLQES